MSRAFRLGVFVVTTLLFLAIGIFLIGNKKFLFSSTYRVKADFQNVSGLNNGADVRVGGIHEGTVTRIDLPRRPEDKVTVEMDMEKSTENVIKKDSIASIKTEGLLGDKYVEISFGSDEGATIQDGDVIGSQTPKDLSDLATATAVAAKAGATSFQDDMEALKHNFVLRGFFQKRGYDDTGELTKHEVSRLPAKPHAKNFVYDAGKIFSKPDSAKLKNQETLKEAGKFLEDNKFDLVVVVTGEAVGDTQKDRVLTEARANVVRDFLVQNFKLDDTRIKTKGLGKTKDADYAGKVQIIVYSPGPGVPAAQNQSSGGQ